MKKSYESAKVERYFARTFKAILQTRSRLIPQSAKIIPPSISHYTKVRDEKNNAGLVRGTEKRFRVSEPRRERTYNSCG